MRPPKHVARCTSVEILQGRRGRNVIERHIVLFITNLLLCQCSLCRRRRRH